MADLSKRKRQQRARLLEALGFCRSHNYGGPDEGYELPAAPSVLDAATRCVMANPTGPRQLLLPQEAPVAPALDEEKLATALADPVIVWPGWEGTMPGWIWQAITEERLACLAMGGGDDLATLAEVLAYLYCAGLCAPLSHEWAEIFCNLAARYMAARGATLPEDLQPRAFTDYEEQLLQELRWDIRQTQQHEAKKRRREQRKRESTRAPAAAVVQCHSRRC